MPRIPSTHIDDPTEFGNRLKAARLAASLSQRSLAFAGCTAAYISTLEAGRRVASLQVVRELANRLGVTEDYLSRGQPDRRAEPFEITQARIENLLRMYPAGSQSEVLAAIDDLVIGLTEQRKIEIANAAHQHSAESSLVAAGLTKEDAHEVVTNALSRAASSDA